MKAFNYKFNTSKIEEIENSYNEILKNFENLIMKYKIIKEEKLSKKQIINPEKFQDLAEVKK